MQFETRVVQSSVFFVVLFSLVLPFLVPNSGPNNAIMARPWEPLDAAGNAALPELKQSVTRAPEAWSLGVNSRSSRPCAAIMSLPPTPIGYFF